MSDLLSVRSAARTYVVEDMTVRSDGSGRIVEAYMARFAPVRAEIRDQDGHYWEEHSRSAFSKTLSDKGLRIPVFYNHARTLDGTPDGALSLPVGVPVEIRPDESGVFTATRYLENPLADHVLDGIKQGAIRGMSYSGRFLKSVKDRARSRGELPVIRRNEIALREFGPTPIPAYPDAAILGTRAAQFLAMLDTLPADKLAELMSQFELSTPFDEPGISPGTATSAAARTVDEPHSALRSASLRSRIRAAKIIRGME